MGNWATGQIQTAYPSALLMIYTYTCYLVIYYLVNSGKAGLLNNPNSFLKDKPLTQGQFTPLLASLPSITFDGHRPCDPIPIIGPGLQQNMS
ncbi:hypothetical protein EYC84_001733 [Monilinia fructicola]|uniref:Uncharacterized protein n=1 Tax=Monilinia fructicola TaxID=38448 RepID=A0A5M9JVF0_MONFR|nr:hypothetical protein EYC84_001733 [Monilinia fructicola]